MELANPAGAFMAGQQYAQQMKDMQRQNALAQLYQSQGAGIAQGDQGAINALAGIDPMAAMQAQNNALGMQQTRQSMAFDAEKMAMLREQSKQAAAAEVAKMTADQVAAEQEKLATVLRGAAAVMGDRPRFESFLSSHGVDPSTIPPGTEPAAIAMVQGGLDALKMFTPKPEPKGYRPATAQEAAQYGAAAGQINQDTGEFKAINPPSGMSITTNPDGTMSMTQGPGAGGVKPATEAEAKNAGFLIRMQDSSAILDRFEAQGSDLVATLKAQDPTGLMNYTQTKEYQQYDQAKRDFVNSILRRESGAAISPSEFANAERQYFPVPGDSPEVIAQKRQNRANTVAGVAVGAGKTVNNPAVTGSNGIDAGGDYSKMGVSELTAIDIGALTPDQKAKLSARLKELGF